MPHHAPLWKRGLAYIIDTFLIYIIIMVPFRSKLVEVDASRLLTVSILIAILSLLYWLILEYKIKQSVGKMLFNIYVKSQTKNLSFWQCFIRNLTKISVVFLFFDTMYLLITKGHQRYLEKISKTEVDEYAKKG